MNEATVIDAFAALAQETRLRILRYLVQQGPKGASAGEISDAVGASSSRASFHLATLTDAGLVDSERRSRHIIYRVNFTVMGDLVGYLIKDCCANHKDVTACCPCSNCC